jgi:hypothetical protein
MSITREEAKKLMEGAIARGYSVEEAKAKIQDKYFNQEQKEEPIDIAGNAKAFLQNAGDAATLGYAPEIAATVRKGIEAVSPDSDIDAQLKEQGFTIQENDQSVNEIAQNIRKQVASDSDKFPVASIAGQVAGSIGLGGAAGTALKGVKGARALAGAGKGFKGIMLGAGGAGAEGFAYNPDSAEGEGDLLDRLKTAAISAGTFGALKGLGNVGRKMGKWSNENALKSLGLKKGTRKLISQRGNFDDVAQVIKEVDPLKFNSRDAAESISSAKRLIYEPAEDAINKSNALAKFDGMTGSIYKDLKKPVRTRVSRDYNEKLKELLKENLSFNGGKSDIKNLNQIRREMDSLAKFGEKEVKSTTNEAAEDIANKLRKYVDEGMSFEDPAISKQFKEANKKYSALKSIENDIVAATSEDTNRSPFALRNMLAVGGILGAGRDGELSSGDLMYAAPLLAYTAYGKPATKRALMKIQDKLSRLGGKKEAGTVSRKIWQSLMANQAAQE